jgi:hypothetical protein
MNSVDFMMEALPGEKPKLKLNTHRGHEVQPSKQGREGEAWVGGRGERRNDGKPPADLKLTQFKTRFFSTIVWLQRVSHSTCWSAGVVTPVVFHIQCSDALKIGTKHEKTAHVFSCLLTILADLKSCNNRAVWS